MIKVDLPEELAAFFRSLAQTVPICPNCRNLLDWVRIDEHSGDLFCGHCDQPLVMPHPLIRVKLLAFMAQTGLVKLLDDLNGVSP